jgi:lipoprotein-anchoring transpeptidase ErfK/SrfK
MSARLCAALLGGAILLAGCMPGEMGPVVALPPEAEPAEAPAPLPDPELVATYAARADGERMLPAVDVTKFHRALLRSEVEYPTAEAPGTIVIDTKGPFLYFVEGEGKATRYGISIGREGFGWKGTGTVARTAKWPRWTPPPEMIKREPYLEKWKDGQPGGVGNPLGARALYIYFGGRDSGYRIHGTNTPSSIGWAASSGCFRMLNQDVIDLYERAPKGAKVIVI